MTRQRGSARRSFVRRTALAAALGIALACNKDTSANKAAAAASSAPAASAAPAKIALIRAADWIGSEWSEDALKVGLQEEGLEPDRDFVFKSSSAQGDLATLPNLVDAVSRA